MGELRVGATVRGRDGDLGQLDAVIIDPTTRAITHIVLTHDRLGPRLLIPESAVVQADAEVVEVDLDHAGLDACDRFDAPNYNIPGEDFDHAEVAFDPDALFLEPYATPMDGWVLTSHERVPKGEVTIRRGSEVFTSDGTKVGHVDEFLVDPDDGHITHVVLREGRLRHVDVVVPVGAATGIEDDRVVLDLDLTQVDALDKIPVRRHGHVHGEPA
ncbi:MAG: PRC-barrel domain-containing protein [Acidimicrobiales bacterium]